MPSYRMLAYFGRMISTAFPLSSSSRLRPATASPSPPALATGAHSAVTITTYTTHPPRAVSCTSRYAPAHTMPPLGERHHPPWMKLKWLSGQLRFVSSTGHPEVGRRSFTAHQNCHGQPRAEPRRDDRTRVLDRGASRGR